MSCSRAGGADHRIFVYANLANLTEGVDPEEAKIARIVEVIQSVPCYRLHINDRFDGFSTLLHRAIEQGNILLANALLRAGADERMRDLNGHTAVQIAERFKDKFEVGQGILFKCKQQLPSVQKAPPVVFCPVSSILPNEYDLDDDEMLEDLAASSTEASIVSVPVAPALKKSIFEGISNEDFLAEFLEYVKGDDLEGIGLLRKKYRSLSKFIMPENKQSLLHIAVANGASYDFVESLITKGYLGHGDNDDQGRTPLHFAAIHNNPEAFKALLRRTRNPYSTVDNERRTPFHYAAMSGSLIIIRNNLRSSCYPDKHGYTLLHVAAMQGQTAVVECFKECLKGLQNFSESCSARELEEQLTPLELAARAGHLGVVVKLLPFADDATKQNSRKLALDNDHDGVVYFIDNNQICDQAVIGFDTLTEKVQLGYDVLTAYIKEQLALGADVDALQEGETLLYRAVKEQNTLLMHALVEVSGAKMDVKSNDYIPLHRAIIDGYLEGVTFLGKALRAADEARGLPKSGFDRGHNLYRLSAQCGDKSKKSIMHAFFANQLHYMEGTRSSGWL